ncbi:MAG: PEGA domain-containing protein [Myxococcaceae bacterium]|nr:PEGA domain-containing protein [Myxococcaceae bacterium]
MLLIATLAAVLAQSPAPTLADQARKADGDTNPKMAVPDFTTTAGNESLAAMLAGSVATEIDRTGLFQVTTSDQVRSLLSLERQRQLLGCNDDSCTSNIAGQLGVDFLVNGRLTRLTDPKKATTGLTLDLSIVEVKSGKRVSSREVSGTSEADLVGRLTENVAALIAPLLSGRQGFIVVIASEDGSVVKVDGTQLGTTPMTQRLAVAGGPHVLRIEKAGFTSVQKQVRVAPDQVTEESIRLVPSPDFIDAYEKKQWGLRIGAFIATGLAVAGIATFAVMQGQAQASYGDPSCPAGAGGLPTCFAGLRASLVSMEDASVRQAAEAMRNRINSQLAISYVAGGVGLASAVAATVLFLIGDDPNRYQSYRGPKTSAWLLPSGAGGVFAWDF